MNQTLILERCCQFQFWKLNKEKEFFFFSLLSFNTYLILMELPHYNVELLFKAADLNDTEVNLACVLTVL